MSDIFHWRMDASMHRKQVAILRSDIHEANASDGSIPIREIFVLLPLQTQQADDAIRRGDIRFTAGQFENRADSSLLIEFGDAVLDTFSVDIPAVWHGEVSLNGQALEIAFTPPLELEIPRLAQMGVSRSSFQRLERIRLLPAVAVSILRDRVSAEKETWVEAILSREPHLEPDVPQDVSTYVEMFASSDKPCAPPSDEPNYYLIRRRNDQLCFIHYGQVVVGGQVAYDVLFGPATYAQCEQQQTLLCPDFLEELERLDSLTASLKASDA